MNGLVRFLRDPLCHFLAAALALFVIVGWLGPEDGVAEDTTIVVDRDGLLTFMQYRMKAFAPEAAAARLDGMSPAERQRVIRDYVREQALYREAKALGLAAEDYVMKRRMIQKMTFVADSMARATVSVDKADVRAHYAAHRNEYAVPASLTFTHVFFDADKRGLKQAEADARATIARLNAAGAGFSDHGTTGDRFPFLRNYVERTPAFVDAHFGEDAINVLQAAPVGRWSGPIQSPYGLHAVFLRSRTDARVPPLAEIRDRVTEDARRAAIDGAASKALDRMVDAYRVINRLDTSTENAKTEQAAAGAAASGPSS